MLIRTSVEEVLELWLTGFGLRLTLGLQVAITAPMLVAACNQYHEVLRNCGLGATSSQEFTSERRQLAVRTIRIPHPQLRATWYSIAVWYISKSVLIVRPIDAVAC